MRAALGGDKRMNLINDDGVNSAENLSRLRSEHQVERLRCGDENLSGMATEFCALTRWSVSGANGNGWLAKRNAGAARGFRDSGEWCPKIALDIDGEGFERRNVEDARAFRGALRLRMEHEAIQAPEEGREGFAAAGGREDQSAFAAGNDRPAHALRCCWLAVGALEPLHRDGMEAGEGVCFVLCLRIARCAGHSRLEYAADELRQTDSRKGAKRSCWMASPTRRNAEG